ncbi:MAG: hypothetical protein A3B44_03145 [Candidatus Levybacteria bacterium RIFCSPLOWO2_01_FULL_38_21]|nr:MAG: hypothetical protein A3B44_03145 [Candidatus Levybacteria bacterium RIFCSPLOWO2_01_FULL_38_21]
MSVPAERLAELAERYGMVDYANDLREAARRNRERGGLEKFPHPVWKRKIDNFIDLGFHSELGQSEIEYRRSLALPEGVVQPEAYKGRFDLLIPVEGRIPLKRQYELAGIREWIDTGKITNITPILDGPFAIWTHDARRYRPYSVEQAIKQFKDDEVGSPQIEVIALYLQYPEFFRDQGVAAAGSRDECDRAPELYMFAGEPEANASWIGHRDQRWGALSRGKEIINLGA